MRAKKSNSGQDAQRLKGVDCYCRECHYPLTGLRSPGSCPECGCDFDFTRLLSYTFEPQPTSLIERVLFRRPTALAAAGCLELILVILTTDRAAFAQRQISFLAVVIIFAMVWLVTYATTPDFQSEGRLHFVLVGSLIGTLAFVPIAWNAGWSAFMGGYFLGLVCGLIVYQVKESLR